MIGMFIFSIFVMLWSFSFLFWGWNIAKRSIAEDFKNYGKTIYKKKVYHCCCIEDTSENKEIK